MFGVMIMRDNIKRLNLLLLPMFLEIKIENFNLSLNLRQHK